jgi:hypothetical protein
VDEETETAEARLALEPRHEVVGQPDALQRRAEHELARMENERVLLLDLDELGQLRLLDLDVDERVAVVVKDTEEPVDADVDTRRLQQRVVVRVDFDPPLGEQSGDRRVGEDHCNDSYLEYLLGGVAIVAPWRSRARSSSARRFPALAPARSPSGRSGWSPTRSASTCRS